MQLFQKRLASLDITYNPSAELEAFISLPLLTELKVKKSIQELIRILRFKKDFIEASINNCLQVANIAINIE